MTATVGSPTDPATAVVLARRLLQSGAWRTVPKTGDATDKAWYLLHAKVPAALAVLPRVAVSAMTKAPPPGGCHWCVAHLLAVLSFGDGQEDAYPPHDDEHVLAFLGAPCSRCAARHEARLIADRERDHLAAITAAGLTPAAARRIRSPAQLRVVADLRRLEQARQPRGGPAATGVIWPAGQDAPSAVTAAIEVWARRRPRGS
jgi:hypothetical protein